MNISARARINGGKQKGAYAEAARAKAALQFKWNVLFCMKRTNTYSFVRWLSEQKRPATMWWTKKKRDGIEVADGASDGQRERDIVQ